MSELNNIHAQDSTAVVAAAILSINNLEGRIETAVHEYDLLKLECESVVESWRWASAEMNHLMLLNNERGRYPRGRWLKKRPSNSGDCFEYGLNHQGRPAVIRQGIWGASNPIYETFFIYNDSYAEAVKYSPMFKNTRESRYVSVVRQSIVNKIPIDCTWYATNQRGYETYQHESGNVTGIDSTWTNAPHEENNVLSAQYAATYDQSGTLASLDVTYRALGSHKGGTANCYKKKPSK